MSDKTRFQIPEKPKHPRGWACENCFHMVKDNRPGSTAMKCTRNPPVPHPLIGPGGQFQGAMSISPPVNQGEWCGEFKRPDAMFPPSANG